MSRAENHDQEHERHHHFADKAGDHRILPRRMLGKAIRGQSARQIKTLLAAGDEIQNIRGNDGADHVRDDVGQQFRRLEAPADKQTD